MGKKYHCDYCDKTMVATPAIVKTHNKGMVHQKLVLEHYQGYKDPKTILAEESKKKPCSRYPRGECQFGSICRFSHYSREELDYYREIVEFQEQSKIDAAQPSFEDLYQKLQDEKLTSQSVNDNTILYDQNGVTHVFPWTYNTVLDSYQENLPASIRRLVADDFWNAEIISAVQVSTFHSSLEFNDTSLAAVDTIVKYLATGDSVPDITDNDKQFLILVTNDHKVNTKYKNIRRYEDTTDFPVSETFESVSENEHLPRRLLIADRKANRLDTFFKTNTEGNHLTLDEKFEAVRMQNVFNSSSERNETVSKAGSDSKRTPIQKKDPDGNLKLDSGLKTVSGTQGLFYASIKRNDTISKALMSDPKLTPIQENESEVNLKKGKDKETGPDGTQSVFNASSKINKTISKALRSDPKATSMQKGKLIFPNPMRLPRKNSPKSKLQLLLPLNILNNNHRAIQNLNQNKWGGGKIISLQTRHPGTTSEVKQSVTKQSIQSQANRSTFKALTTKKVSKPRTMHKMHVDVHEKKTPKVLKLKKNYTLKYASKVNAIMEFLENNMMSTLYISREVKRIRKTGEIRDRPRVMLWFFEHYTKYKFKDKVYSCYIASLSKIVKQLDVWRYPTNGLIIDDIDPASE